MLHLGLASCIGGSACAVESCCARVDEVDDTASCTACELLAGHALHSFLHGGDTGGTADQDNLVDVGGLQTRVGQRLVRQGCDGLHVLAGGDLRHDAAVQRVHIRLGQNGVGQHLPSVPHHGHRRLVAGGFKG